MDTRLDVTGLGSCERWHGALTQNVVPGNATDFDCHPQARHFGSSHLSNVRTPFLAISADQMELSLI